MLFANVLDILQVVPLVGHSHAVLRSFLIDLRFELLLLLEGSVKGHVLDLDLLQRARDHLPDEELTVTQATDGASIFDLAPASVKLDILFLLLKVPLLRQAALARRFAAEMTVTALKVSSLLPPLTASVAALRCVLVIAWVNGLLEEKDRLGLNELKFTVSDFEAARCLEHLIDFVARRANHALSDLPGRIFVVADEVALIEGLLEGVHVPYQLSETLNLICFLHRFSELTYNF